MNADEVREFKRDLAEALTKLLEGKRWEDLTMMEVLGFWNNGGRQIIERGVVFRDAFMSSQIDYYGRPRGMQQQNHQQH